MIKIKFRKIFYLILQVNKKINNRDFFLSSKTLISRTERPPKDKQLKDTKIRGIRTP